MQRMHLRRTNSINQTSMGEAEHGPTKAESHSPGRKATTAASQPNLGITSNGTVNPVEGEDGEDRPVEGEDGEDRPVEGGMERIGQWKGGWRG
jgi:hypothetical protein